MRIETLSDCHDCHAKPGQVHKPGCDVEHCSVCGGQKLSCDCTGHDPQFARWTGLWPGWAEAAALGLYCKWTDDGWVRCEQNDPEAKADLNRFFSDGLHKKFLVKAGDRQRK